MVIYLFNDTYPCTKVKKPLYGSSNGLQGHSYMRPIDTTYIVNLGSIWLYLDCVLHFYLKNERIPLNFHDAGKAIIDRSLSEALYHYTQKYFSVNRYWHDSLTVTFDSIKGSIVPALIDEFTHHRLQLKDAVKIDYLITHSTLILNVNRGYVDE